ncbi:MAG: hypothetical protein GXP39_08045 [Chloroflexi bacterium]|nr:hypothetical protein [Chloroflexota bacterium]
MSGNGIYRNELVDAFRHAEGMLKSARAVQTLLDIRSRRERADIDSNTVAYVHEHIECIQHHISELERELAQFRRLEVA